MTRHDWTCIVAAIVGGSAAGVMGLSWLNAPPPSTSWSMTTAAGAGYVLLAALASAWVGGVLVLQGHCRVASAVLCVAGIVPGLLEPRAFVATFVLVFAGLLTSSLPNRRARVRLGAGSSSRPASVHPSRA